MEPASLLPSLSRLSSTSLLPPDAVFKEENDDDDVEDDAFKPQRRSMVIGGKLFGVQGRTPSVDGYGPLVYKDEVDPTFERLKTYGSAQGEKGFVAGVLASVDEDTFRAYVVMGTLPADVQPHSPIDVELLDVLFDRKTYESMSASPVVGMRDPVFTWAGVVGIAKLWWDTLVSRT